MYKKMYLLLFNRVTDAIKKLQEGKVSDGLQMLEKAQQDCETLYIDGEGEE